MNRTDFRFFDTLRVRWAEVDMQKIVFNGHYLMYFDTAVAAYWRAMAMPYHEVMEALGGDLFVRKATVEYLGSARYEDRCDVGMRCARLGNRSITFAAALFRGEKLLVHGELVYVFAEPATQTSRPVPEALRQALDAFEQGQPMFEVETPAWSDAGDAIASLRRVALVEENGLPEQLVADADDARAVQAVAVNRFNMPVACGRLLVDADARGQIGRMAVTPSVRGAGLGRALMQTLIAEARGRGVRELLLHAQPSLVAYYAAQGFALRGEPFEVAGVAHHEMVRAA